MHWIRSFELSRPVHVVSGQLAAVKPRRYGFGRLDQANLPCSDPNIISTDGLTKMITLTLLVEKPGRRSAACVACVYSTVEDKFVVSAGIGFYLAFMQGLGLTWPSATKTEQNGFAML